MSLSWWFISIPLISTKGPPTALRNCLLMSGVSLFSFIRAWAEELRLALPAHRRHNVPDCGTEQA